MKTVGLLLSLITIVAVERLHAQFYDSTRDSSASVYVNSVARSVGPDKFQGISRTQAFALAKTLGELDRNILTPEAFVEHIREAEEVRDRFYPDISALNFRTYLLPIRIRTEICPPNGWRKMLRDKLEPQITGVIDPGRAASTVLAWCNSKVRLTDGDRCYRLGLKGDLDPLTTLKGGYGSEVDMTILAVAALRSVGVAARLVEAPALANESGGKVWLEYRSSSGWNAWVPSAPTGTDGKRYLLQQFGDKFSLILANPEEPINITSDYIRTAHIEVALSNLNPQERPGWNLLVAGRNQLSPITGRNIYVRMSDSLDVGPGTYVLVAGDHTICGIKPLTLKAGESGSYTLDSTQKGSQAFNILDVSSASITGGDSEMNSAMIHNPGLW